MRTLALTVTALVAAPAVSQVQVRILDPKLHHLGDSHVPSWTEVPADPEATDLRLAFEAAANGGEQVLSLRHRDVDDPWTVTLNGIELGHLRKGKAMRLDHHVIPPGTLRAGRNELVIASPRKTDDIVIGDLRLHAGTLRQVLRLQSVPIHVTDPGGAPLPARVTITDESDRLVDLYYGARLHTALRPGVAYTADGTAGVELPPGHYKLYATRGMEWGLATTELTVADAEPGQAAAPTTTLTLAREVDTRGFVAADTHIHTLTFSGHGDASVEERLVTLAGEGVELAIATDHNHQTDYRPLQEQMHLHEHFTAVTGNEVTTKVGHFNAFPLPPNGKKPDYHLHDWIKLVGDIRRRGAKVVILNHPRWPRIPTGPFGVYHLDRLTGDLPGRRGVPFDAMELVNSGSLQTDPMYLFVDWFALLNHGDHITAVGSSDSHTVGEPVGQGRTYVRSSTDVPSEIDVDEACRAFRRGDTTISFGIFSDLVVAGRYRMGELVPVHGGDVELELRVAAPSWVLPRTVKVFVDGTEVGAEPVPATDGKPTDVRLPMRVEVPTHDAWLVCVVLGRGVQGPYWHTERPYTLAATNPVYLDADGDGDFSSPRALATALVARHGTAAEKLAPALAKVDDAVAIEAISLARARYEKGATTEGKLLRARQRLTELIEKAAPRKVYRRYLQSLPDPTEVIEAAAKRAQKKHSR